jgi:hypothetical protein
MTVTNTYETQVNKVTNKPFYAEGQLVLKNDLNDYDFGVYNEKEISNKSITKYLNRIYKSECPYVRLHIKNLNSEYVIKGFGELTKKKDSIGLYDWFVGNFELGTLLYEWGENDVNVKIEQIMEAECKDEKTRYKVM